MVFEQVATSLVLLFPGWSKGRLRVAFLAVLWGCCSQGDVVGSQGQVSVWPTLGYPTCLSHQSHFPGPPGGQNPTHCLHLKAALAKHLLGRKETSAESP